MSETESTPGAESAADRYQSLLEQSDELLASLRERDGVFAKARLVLFGLSLLVSGFAMFSSVGVIAWVVGGALFAGFLLAAILNEPVRDAMDAESRHVQVLKKLMARLNRDWDALDSKAVQTKLKTVTLGEHEKDVADDLDLLGRSSLFQFVSMAGTTIGMRTLANWLTSAAESKTAKERSQAVKRLSKRREERLRFYSLAAHVGQGTGDPDQFIEWSQRESWLKRHSWMSIWANLSAVLAGAAIAILIVSRIAPIPQSVAQLALLLAVAIVIANVLITTLMLGPAHQIFAVAMASRESVNEYQELFSAAEWLESETVGETPADRLHHLHAVLVGDGEHSARVGMGSLQRVAAMGSMRTSAATFLLYLPLQAFALWDVRVLRKLEAWQDRYREDVPGWFDAFGELEALMSLAAVSDENPTWVFPEWVEIGDGRTAKFESTELGHPLLSESERVCNDVTIGPSGTVLLVTGSNMSGKSTMLRSVGLNVSLAGTGAPVCASRLSLPSTELATSIRVRDNLAEGVSFYMAELKRLKGVVDRARAMATNPDSVSLFLLDEILQGTNSRERQIAVTQVLRHLVDCGAIGAISTHDLELADERELQSVSEIVHFRETITPDAEGNEQMTFDYQMRSGVSPTTNALRLLEIVGLGESD